MPSKTRSENWGDRMVLLILIDMIVDTLTDLFFFWI